MAELAALEGGVGLEAGALLWVRLWAALRVQAVGRTLLGASWNVVSGGLALVLVLGGTWPVEHREGPWPWLMAWELALGTVVGLFVSLPAYALVGAATVQALALRIPTASWRALVVAVVAGLGFELGAHHRALTALAGLSSSFPPGRPELWGVVGLEGLVGALDEVLRLGLALATPVLLVVVVVDLLTAVLARAEVPAAALAGGGVVVRSGLAAIAITASWGALPEAWSIAIEPP